MLAADVLLEQVEGDKVAILALGTRIVQQLVEGILDLQVRKHDSVALVVQARPDVGFQRAKRQLVFRVDDLEGGEDGQWV